MFQQLFSRFREARCCTKAAYTTALLAVVSGFLSADQTLLAPNLTLAARDFGFDDKQRDLYLGGYLSAGFFAVGAPAAVLVGRLADSFDRLRLLLVVVVVGAAPCIAMYWVTTFAQLYALRMLTGISMGGSLPIFYSMLGDLYGKDHRVTGSTVLQLALVLGAGVGQVLAGSVGAATNWRVPFVVVAVPTILLTVLLVCTGWDPVRGGTEEALRHLLRARSQGLQCTQKAASWKESLAALLAPTNMLVLLQSVPSGLPLAVLLTFANDYFHEDRGLTVGGASTIVLLYTVGLAVGVIVGGLWGQRLYLRWKPSLGLLSGVANALSAPPSLWLLNAPVAHTSWVAISVACLAGGFFTGVPFAITCAMTINVTEPNARGLVTGAQSVVSDLFMGLGPVLVALMITQMGRRSALNLTIALGLTGCVLLLATMLTITRDESRMQARLAAAVARTASGNAPISRRNSSELSLLKDPDAANVAALCQSAELSLFVQEPAVGSEGVRRDGLDPAAGNGRC